MTKKQTTAFRLENISKSFLGGKIKANQDITFFANYGRVVGLVGENGAGKSTLMSILFGLYQPDSGSIYIDDVKVNISSPTVANKLGIGMVPQHFKLVGNMTVTENVMLGVEQTRFGILNRKAVAQKISELSRKYGLEVDPNAKIDSLSIGMKQRVEIIKMLFKEANVLVFDEPTSVLTPQEAENLIKIIKQFKVEGKAIIFISHKLKEVIDVCDDVVVMRKGKITGDIEAKKATPMKLSEMMVGETVELVFEEKKESKTKKFDEVVADVKNVSLFEHGVKKLKDVSFTVSKGEIVGLVGIDGNGQSEVVEILGKLKKPTSGSVLLSFDEKNHSRSHLLENGLGHIPEDRQKDGVALDLTTRENMVFNRLNKYYKYGFIQAGKINKFTDKVIKDFDVRGADGGKSTFRGLSGGNQQKAVTGREVEYATDLLLAAHPTRGVDIGAIKNIYKQIIKVANKGTAVVLLSGELDEIISVSDKLVVFSHGEVMGIVKPNEVSRNEIGLMMTGTSLEELRKTTKKVSPKKEVTKPTAKKETVKKVVVKSTTKKATTKPVAKKTTAKMKGVK